MASAKLPLAQPRTPHTPSLTIEGKPLKLISMRIPEDLKEKLDQDAKATGVAYSETLRQLAVAFMEFEPAKRRALIQNVCNGHNFNDAQSDVHLEMHLAGA